MDKVEFAKMLGLELNTYEDGYYWFEINSESFPITADNVEDAWKGAAEGIVRSIGLLVRV